jgi:soluble lytic murein transglycosylase-like protein
VCVAQPADAQVYELGPDGSLVVRDGGGEVTWEAVDGQTVAAAQQNGHVVVPDEMVTTIGNVPVPGRFSTPLAQAATAAGISPTLLAALVWQESRWNPSAVSVKGAQGLTQLMPATARELGVDPRDPVANLHGGARYLRSMLDSFNGDVERALAAYNAGPGRVRRANGVPRIKETQNYVRSILNRLGAASGGSN